MSVLGPSWGGSCWRHPKAFLAEKGPREIKVLLGFNSIAIYGKPSTGEGFSKCRSWDSAWSLLTPADTHTHDY